MNEIDLDEWKYFFDARVWGQHGQTLTASYLEYIEELKRRDLPPIFEFSHLSDLVGVDYRMLSTIAHSPHNFYRTFSIPKRSGGIREIDTPRPILLETQRWILSEILSKRPISNNAHGFVFDRSIITNAKVHVGNKELLKLDIKDFFTSIKIHTVYKIFSSAGYPDNVCRALSRLTTKNSCLPQGAPTSPTISNLACLDMDIQLDEAAKKNRLVYTRYADDMNFSGEKVSDDMKDIVSKIISKYGFSLNSKKTNLAKEGRRKTITGISISSGELKLPRSYIRNLRKQIHFVSSRGIAAHSVATRNYDPLLLDRLLGMVSFWLQVSPHSRAAQDANAKLRRYIKTFSLQ